MLYKTPLTIAHSVNHAIKSFFIHKNKPTDLVKKYTKSTLKQHLFHLQYKALPKVKMNFTKRTLQSRTFTIKKYAYMTILFTHLSTMCMPEPMDILTDLCMQEWTQKNSISSISHANTAISLTMLASQQQLMRENRENVQKKQLPLKKISCPLCELFFEKTCYLKWHIKKHEGEKVFECSVPECSFVCGLSGDLARHTRFHTNERPYKCPECTHTSKRQSHLNDHIKTHRQKNF